MNLFGTSNLTKIYVAGQNENFPSSQGVCWSTGTNVMFFGGGNNDSNFPLCFNTSLSLTGRTNTGKPFRTLTSGRLKTIIPRECTGASAVCHQGKAYIYGGRHWKRLCQPASEDFFAGELNGNRTAYSWDSVGHTGCAPSPRFGHSFTSCDNFAFLYGGLNAPQGRYTHVNTNLFSYTFALKSWKAEPSVLPPLAYHSCTYVGNRTAVITGGLQLNAAMTGMTRPGHIHVLNFLGHSTRVISYDANLFISGHEAIHLGDFIYFVGGYEAPSSSGMATPSSNMIRLHVPSLLSSKLQIERDSAPVSFAPCYASKQGIHDMLIFQINTKSVWKFVDGGRVDSDQEIEDDELHPDAGDEETDDTDVNIPMELEQENIDEGSDIVNLDCDSTVFAGHSDSDSDDSDDDYDDEPLFCNAQSCDLNNLPPMQLQKLKWTQCHQCSDWFHERCMRSKKCEHCN